MRTSLLLLLALTACTPALKIKRLSPPEQVLGTARTVRIEVTPAANDALPGEPLPVSEEAKTRLAERIKAAGYTVCTTPGCGDGVLQVKLDQVVVGGPDAMPHRPTFEMMETAMRVVRGQFKSSEPAAPPAEKVHVLLEGSLTLQQADGKVGFRQRFSNSNASVGTPGDVLRAALDSLAKGLGERLSLQAPLREVTLEGGGPLNRGLELIHAGDFAGAAAYFTELTRTQPELDGAWYDLGFALEAQSRWQPALQAYEEAEKRAQKPHYRNAANAVRRALFVPVP